MIKMEQACEQVNFYGGWRVQNLKKVDPLDPNVNFLNLKPDNPYKESILTYVVA